MASHARLKTVMAIYSKQVKTPLPKSPENSKILPMSQKTAIINNKTPTQKMPKAFFVNDPVSSQQSAVSSQQSAVSSQQSAVSSQYTHLINTVSII
jgi:hypothetical protein